MGKRAKTANKYKYQQTKMYQKVQNEQNKNNQTEQKIQKIVQKVTVFFLKV